MKIKKYFDFINEKMGVPAGITESAQKIYSLILSEVNPTTDFEFEELLDPNQKTDTDIEIDFDIECELNIGKLVFKNIIFTIQIILDDNLNEVECISWGVAVPPTSQGDYEIYHDINKKNNIELNLNIAANGKSKFSEIIDYLIKMRDFTIGVLSHELKHVYDKYMLGKELISDLADYSTWARLRTGFEPVDDFLYNLYVVSNAENLVRPSEIAAQIENLGITKSQFKEFIESTRIYKELIGIKSFSYEGLKKDILNDIENIRAKFDNIPDTETDEDVMRTILILTYTNVTNDYSERMIDILGLNNQMKRLMGKIKDADIDYYNKYINKRVFKNADSFFEYWEKKLKFDADKVFRKISKLYDMCKDDDVNPLMSKISQKKEGEYIVNKDLYNKLMSKNKTKVKYPK